MKKDRELDLLWRIPAAFVLVILGSIVMTVLFIIDAICEPFRWVIRKRAKKEE